MSTRTPSFASESLPSSAPPGKLRPETRDQYTLKLRQRPLSLARTPAKFTLSPCSSTASSSMLAVFLRPAGQGPPNDAAVRLNCAETMTRAGGGAGPRRPSRQVEPCCKRARKPASFSGVVRVRPGGPVPTSTPIHAGCQINHRVPPTVRCRAVRPRPVKAGVPPAGVSGFALGLARSTLSIFFDEPRFLAGPV